MTWLALMNENFSQLLKGHLKSWFFDKSFYFQCSRHLRSTKLRHSVHSYGSCGIFEQTLHTKSSLTGKGETTRSYYKTNWIFCWDSSWITKFLIVSSTKSWLTAKSFSGALVFSLSVSLTAYSSNLVSNYYQ